MKAGSIALGTALLLSQFSSVLGSITGVVIKAGTAVRQPLRNARVQLLGTSSTFASVIVRTNVNGQFGFRDLPLGQYTLTVTCDGYIRQQSPSRIVLSGNQLSANAVFELESAPTATGWVLDMNGEPMPNVSVEALRRTYDVRGNPKLARAARAVTNDRGEYRIFWLDPGEFFFYATSLPTEENAERQPAGVVPTYFPGVTTLEDAKPVRLDIGREIRVDFRLR